jgi:hypothetical protein
MDRNRQDQAGENRPLTVPAGVAVILMWITAALGVLFMAAVADDVDRWLSAHSHLSGWVQALFSVLAIVAAGMLGRRQMNAAIATERERNRLQLLRHLQYAHVAFSSLAFDAAEMRRLNPVYPEYRQEIDALSQGELAELEALLLHELPPVVAMQAVSAKAHLLQIGALCRRIPPRATEIARVSTASLVLQRIAIRGRDLSWSLILRTATEGELIEERQMRDELEELRPKPKPEGEVMEPVSIYMKPAQRERLQRLGGAPWVRDRIDKAKEPKE